MNVAASPDLGAIAFPVAAILMLALAAWGLRASLAGRPVFRERIFDE